jgi:para-nitrobenzyl esterase
VLESSQFQPNRDGVVLPEQPIEAIAAGRHHHVALVVGANADETGREAPALASESAYQALVQSQFGPLASSVLAEYPASSFATPRKAYVALTSDARFICPARRVARAAVAAQDEPVYRYYFTRAASPLGAVHGLEVPYVFGTFAAIPYTPAAADSAISGAMQATWTAFARSGDPGAVGAVTWPRYATDGSDPTLVLDDPVTTIDGVRSDKCDFWDGLLP